MFSELIDWVKPSCNSEREDMGHGVCGNNWSTSFRRILVWSRSSRDKTCNYERETSWWSVSSNSNIVCPWAIIFFWPYLFIYGLCYDNMAGFASGTRGKWSHDKLPCLFSNNLWPVRCLWKASEINGD